MPTLSVILPVYNAAKYLSLSIESILWQDFTDFELLIIDDGSTDESMDIITRYLKDKRVKLFSSSHNGLVSVLNKGIQLSNGKYIARMDADDISLPSRFSTQIDYLQADNSIGVIGTKTLVIDEYGSFKNNGIYKFDADGINIRMLKENHLCHPSVMIRRELFIKYGLYNQMYKHAEDYELWLRFSKNTKLYNTDEILLMYREHDSNISLTKFAEQSMMASILIYLYSKKINLPNTFSEINFTQIKSICDAEEFKEIIKVWRKGVDDMLILKKEFNLDMLPEQLTFYYTIFGNE